jgi:hypothetical protein
VPAAGVEPRTSKRSRAPQKPWAHLDTTPLFDQTNHTPGAESDGGRSEPDHHTTSKPVEVGLVSNIISFGTGLH